MQYYSVKTRNDIADTCMNNKDGKMIQSHLLAELEALRTDLSITSKKLESKNQAVVILHETLEQCKKERDEFRQMAEQVMNRYQLLRKSLSQGTQSEVLSAKALGQLPSKKLAYLLVESREANKALERELEEMNVKLTDAEGDIKLLRQQLRSSFNQSFGSSSESHPSSSDERKKLISQLERLTAQVKELERELSRCMDEKNEFLSERDIYRNKCDRLNNELNYVLHGDERKIVDIDTLIMEKKSLKYRLQAIEEERNLAMSTLTKYKKMLERKVSKSSSVGSDNAFTPAGSPQHATSNSLPSSTQSPPHVSSTSSRPSQTSSPSHADTTVVDRGTVSEPATGNPQYDRKPCSGMTNECDSPVVSRGETVSSLEPSSESSTSSDIRAPSKESVQTDKLWY